LSLKSIKYRRINEKSAVALLWNHRAQLHPQEERGVFNERIIHDTAPFY
jgi:hypothetical protein